ncbi:hypothetical protein T492DRAFT_882088 [Pavlovales sp. CCMP2436]|nr:hypothetical protein T492DRAFT_882088 [Pavlovales sp. CCMP2436]
MADASSLALLCTSTALFRPPTTTAGTCVTRTMWKDVPQGSDDPILGLNTAFLNDPSPDKVRR